MTDRPTTWRDRPTDHVTDRPHASVVARAEGRALVLVITQRETTVVVPRGMRERSHLGRLGRTHDVLCPCRRTPIDVDDEDVVVVDVPRARARRGVDANGTAVHARAHDHVRD